MSASKTTSAIDAQLAALDGLYLAAFTVAPTAAGGGTEAADSDYARGQISLGAAGDAAETGARQAAIDTLVLLGSAGAAAGYTIAGLAIMSAASGGTMHRFLAYSATIAVGEVPRIPVGELIVKEA